MWKLELFNSDGETLSKLFVDHPFDQENPQMGSLVAMAAPPTERDQRPLAPCNEKSQVL